MGLANRLTEPGGALAGAVALAHELARLPQTCLRNDRRSVYEQDGLTLDRGARERVASRHRDDRHTRRARRGPSLRRGRGTPRSADVGSRRWKVAERWRVSVDERGEPIGCRDHEPAGRHRHASPSPWWPRPTGCATRASVRWSSSTVTGPSASSPSATSCAWAPPAAAPTDPVSAWMTADPDSVAPDVDATDGVREPVGARIPPHPGRRRRPARRHRVDARPDADRADPAGREPRARDPEGARGCRRRRRRPSGTSAGSRASTTTASTTRSSSRRPGRSRTSGTSCSTASCRRPCSARDFAAEVAPLRRVPVEVQSALPEIARVAAGGAAARPPPHDAVAARRVARLPAVARPRRTGAARAGTARLRRRADPPLRTPPPPAGTRDHRASRRPRVRRELPLHDER